MTYLKNDRESGLWIMQKRLSRSSVALLKEVCHISRMIETQAFGSCKNVLAQVVALLKRRVSYLKNDLDFGLWIMQKRLSRSSVALLQIRVSYQE